METHPERQTARERKTDAKRDREIRSKTKAKTKTQIKNTRERRKRTTLPAFVPSVAHVHESDVFVGVHVRVDERAWSDTCSTTAGKVVSVWSGTAYSCVHEMVVVEQGHDWCSIVAAQGHERMVIVWFGERQQGKRCHI